MQTSKLHAIIFFALAFIGSSGFAQTSGAALVGGQAATGAPRPTENTSTSAPPSSPNIDSLAHTSPVLWITSLEVLRSTHGPQLDIVRVRGLASTEGWESAELIPLTKGIPYDGILDLAFVAEAPLDQTAPASFPIVEAVFAIEPGHPFKGIRVHGATNRLTLKTFPGFVESSAAPADCTACTGKSFVPKGSSLPAGKTSADVVREESLPRTLRVVRKNEGIGRLESDPNRLTIVLDDDDRIALAFWD